VHLCFHFLYRKQYLRFGIPVAYYCSERGGGRYRWPLWTPQPTSTERLTLKDVRS
jgi:hypothetical protein